MSLQTSNRAVIVKVLYTFDDRTTFLVRSNRTLSVRLIKLPSQPPDELPNYGCIDLRKCLDLVSTTSPEWFQRDQEYSVYSKDVMEPGEPFVGYGLWSKLHARKSPVLITGQMCRSVVSFCSGNGSMGDTLEVNVRFNPISGATVQVTAPNTSKSATNTRKRSGDASSTSDDSSPSSHSDEFTEPMKRQRSNSTRRSALLSAPQLATRTQSLPFVSENSLAHRILESDKQHDRQVDSKSDQISNRFSNYAKLMKNSPPTRARKTKSFLNQVVKIGNNSVANSSGDSATGLKKCVNCASISDPPYKYHQSGLYEFGNAGLLCRVCHAIEQKGDMEELRRRGELGMKGLLDKPYKKHRTARKHHQQQQRQQIRSMSSPAIDSDDLPGRSGSNGQSTDIDPVYRKPGLPLVGSGASEIADDRAPIATKLNTILIPLDDDDDKENMMPRHSDDTTALMVADISPSLQRIIDSFDTTNQAPNSPTKSTSPGNHEWSNFFNMFQPDEDSGGIETCGTLDIVQEEEDPEVSRVLGKSKHSPPSKTPADKFEATPADADTVPTESTPGVIVGLPQLLAENRKQKKNPVPSSPYFMNQEEKDADSSRTTDKFSSSNWETSSPVTEPTSDNVKA